ncbi:GNAT family N-acetyltransferase [bacterium]|nr:GNAT family N-acetyltransferase [bacterium]
MQKSQFNITRTLDTHQWSSFVKNHPQGNVFHTPEMFHVFSNANNHIPELWATLDSDNQIASLFSPVILNGRNKLFDFFMQRSISYGSLLTNLDTEDLGSIEKLIKSYLKTCKLLPIFIEMRNLTDLSYLRNILLSFGFCFYDYLNYIIPLNLPFEIMLKRICRSTRKRIRKELRDPKLVIETVNSSEKVSICYGILKNSYRHNCVPLADISLFYNAFRILSPKNMIKFTLAKHKNIYIATSIDLLYKDTIYGWYGGFDRHYSKFSANEILMWHLLTWGASQGYKFYDFGGAGKPDETYRVRDFKAKFGGNLVNYGRFLSVNAPVRFYFGTGAYKFFQNTIHFFKSINKKTNMIR